MIVSMLDGVRGRPPARWKSTLEGFEDVGPPPWASEPVLAMREKMAMLRRHFLARVLELGGAGFGRT